MAGLDLTAFTPAMKTKYIKGIQTLLNNKLNLWRWLSHVGGEDGGGVLVGSTGPYPSGTLPPRSVNFAVHLARNDTGGFVDIEASGFQSAGAEGYRQGLMQGRTAYWPANVSIAAVARTKTDPAAFARVMAESSVRVGNNAMNNNERILLGDGSGTLGVAGTVPAVSGNQLIVPLDNFQDARKFSKGMFLNAWSARTAGATQRTVVTAGTAPASIAKIVQVTVSGNTASITLGAATSGTWTTTDIVAGDVFTKANDGIVAPFQGARGASDRREPMGLLGITLDCDTPMENGETIQGLFGINASTQYAAMQTATAGSANSTRGELNWQGYNSRSATARAINNGIMQSLRDVPGINFGETPNLYVCSFGSRFEYVNTLLGIRRNVNTTQLSGQTGGGFSEDIDARNLPEYDGVPVLPHRFAPTYRMTAGDTTTQLAASVLAVNTNYLEIHEWHPMRFIDYDGNTWRLAPGLGNFAPNLTAIIEHTWECITTARNAHSAAHAILASDFS